MYLCFKSFHLLLSFLLNMSININTPIYCIIQHSLNLIDRFQDCLIINNMFQSTQIIQYHILSSQLFLFNQSKFVILRINLYSLEFLLPILILYYNSLLNLIQFLCQ